MSIVLDAVAPGGYLSDMDTTHTGMDRKLETLCDNATRLRHLSQTVAAAAALVAPAANAESLCVWCAEMHPLAPVRRLPLGGECSRCSYSGHDCLVVELG